MIHERINFTEDGRVYMDTYIHDISSQKPSEVEAWRWKLRPHDSWQIPKRPAIIIFPGGGYTMLSDREGEPIALAFMREGFDTFVLYYSLEEYSAYPGSLIDGAKAVWYVRSHAEEWGIDPDAIAVMGFSAGGHAAGLVSTQWNHNGLEEKLGIPKDGAKPNASVICYANATRAGMWNREVSGELKLIDSPEEFKFYKFVSEETSPMFIWHTMIDPLVPSSNALILANACAEKNVPYELHIFTRGTHGLALCDDLTDYEAPIDIRPLNAKQWMPMASQWLKELFHIAP